ncbi:hypothetical protein BC351_00650 [Paenibacillus ferrarius]|uniref:Uncharacterized protein n=1 Tax=Paenibacillus ferrarius TaxID=1469647 RepID=A0A1V4HSH9_9BACL|nr:hypothetical protein [Paenibacillus ferrarius]OPH61782.1 hypothetical protein BC351_00650 [Paenibacillus ferrarius]
MSNQTSNQFSAFASLNRYFELSQISKPTQKQAEEALKQLCEMYEVKSEEELFSRSDEELTEIYLETKYKILNAAKVETDEK